MEFRQAERLQRWRDFARTVVNASDECGDEKRVAEIQEAVERGTLNACALQSLLAGFPVFKITEEPVDPDCNTYSDEYKLRRAEFQRYLHERYGGLNPSRVER